MNNYLQDFDREMSLKDQKIEGLEIHSYELKNNIKLMQDSHN